MLVFVIDPGEQTDRLKEVEVVCFVEQQLL
jgi:hypothetical protein